MTTVKDMKEGLSSSRKPDITHMRTPMMVYNARPCEYGSSKYVRGNFLRPVAPGGYTGTPAREDFERCTAYLRAGISHAIQMLDRMEMHRALDPELRDVDGMKRAAYAVDTDPDMTGKVGPSFLPHIAGTVASLNMVLAQAVACGLLPADPGQPWRDAQCASPYAEEARTAQRRADTERALIEARVSKGAYDVEAAELDREIAHGFGDKMADLDGRPRAEGVRY